MKNFLISPVKEKKSENSPDFNITVKGEDGKTVYLGSAWKKTGQFGTYLSAKLKDAQEYNGVMQPGYDIIVEKPSTERTYQPEDFPIATEQDTLFDNSLPDITPRYPDGTPI